MNELINKLAENAGQATTTVVSFSAAAIGSSVNSAAAIYEWLALAAPLLQAGAWMVAIAAGSLSIVNNLKKKK